MAFSFSPDHRDEPPVLQKFWESEQARRDLRPHEANRLREEFLNRCRSPGAFDGDSDRMGINFACRLIEGEQDELSMWRHLPLVNLLFPREALPWETLQPLPFSERTMWQARAFVSPSSSISQELKAHGGRGWLALESVVRLKPELVEGQWWRYEAAIAERDRPRMAAAFPAVPKTANDATSSTDADPIERERIDGLTYGVAPLLGYRSGRGGTLGVRIWDDRLGDKARSTAFAMHVFTNGMASVKVNYSDRVWLWPVRLDLNSSFDLDKSLYSAGTRENFSQFRSLIFQGGARLHLPLARTLAWRAGYRLFVKGQENREAPSNQVMSGAVEPPGPFNPLGSVLDHGPAVSLVWDSRDSAYTPRQGYFAELEARNHFLSAGAAQSAFLEARLRAEAFHSFSKRTSWSVSGAASLREGTPRRDLLLVWGQESLGLPGLAENRYRSAAGVGLSTEVQQELSRDFRGLAFVTAAALMNPLVDSDRGLIGGGLGVEISLSRRARPTLRAECGWMSGQWNVSVDWKVTL